MSDTAPTRTLNGVELPTAGAWRLDPGHAEVAFSGRHFMLTRIRGRFVDVEASVTIAREPADSSVQATIDMASVDSGSTERDDHLRSQDFFDVEQWPTATFRSTDVTWSADRGTVTGDLTIRDTAHPITFEVEFLGGVVDPWDNQRAIFSAHARIDREDWGLTWNQVLESGGLLVSKQIDIDLEVELVRT